MNQEIAPPLQETPPPAPKLIRVLVMTLVISLGLSIVGSWFFYDWARKGVIAPSGGHWFFRETLIDVPLFRQADPAWGGDLLGPTTGTLAAEGCAVAASAMVLASYGVNTDPGRLNQFLTEHGGYTEEGWIYWERAADFPGAVGRVRFAYENLPSYKLIDDNLADGNPVIVRLRYRNGVTHFVVICGKRGFDYLVRDPGRGADKGVYPLKEFGSRIEALRFYEKLK